MELINRQEAYGSIEAAGRWRHHRNNEMRETLLS